MRGQNLIVPAGPSRPLAGPNRLWKSPCVEQGARWLLLRADCRRWPACGLSAARGARGRRGRGMGGWRDGGGRRRKEGNKEPLALRRSFRRSLPRPLRRSLDHSVAHSLDHSVAHPLDHSIAHSPPTPSSLTPSFPTTAPRLLVGPNRALFAVRRALPCATLRDRTTFSSSLCSSGGGGREV